MESIRTELAKFLGGQFEKIVREAVFRGKTHNLELTHPIEGAQALMVTPSKLARGNLGAAKDPQMWMKESPDPFVVVFKESQVQRPEAQTLVITTTDFILKLYTARNPHCIDFRRVIEPT